MANVCDGLPIHAAASAPICTGYPCDDSTCTQKRYIITPSFIQNGFILRGASGAYVAAVTVCQMNLNPIKVSEVRRQPSNKLVGLPASQIINV